MTEISKHAAIRSQQRGIPPLLIDLLIQFGSTEPAGGGASKVFLDKTGRKRLKAYAGQLAAALKPHLDAYAVLSPDGQIITVAHRLERIRRH
jgi:hypothetical protein